MPCDAFRDPYALLTQANDTNYCNWGRNRPKWVSFSTSAARNQEMYLEWIRNIQFVCKVYCCQSGKETT